MFIALPEAFTNADTFDKLEKDFVALCKKIAAQNAGNLRNKGI
jgi:hypothetical protein